MKYKIITHNDTGDQEWTDYYYIYAESDEEAKDETITRWLENKLGPAAEYVELICPRSGYVLSSHGS